MNEIIPLKKDIIFKTIIGEITEISIDYDYKINNEVVEGTVDISGAYKMTEASVVVEDFFYSIPFSIAISKRIQKDTIKIEVDDFKYSTNKDVLNVNIDLLLTCEEEIIEEKEIENINTEEFNFDEYFNDAPKITKIKFEEEKENNTVISDNIIENNLNIENINNITNNIINDEKKYYKYKVYIVRQNDTIDSICSKYNVNINNIKEYNDINNINVGDKIIIPQIND